MYTLVLMRIQHLSVVKAIIQTIAHTSLVSSTKVVVHLTITVHYLHPAQKTVHVDFTQVIHVPALEVMREVVKVAVVRVCVYSREYLWNAVWMCSCVCFTNTIIVLGRLLITSMLFFYHYYYYYSLHLIYTTTTTTANFTSYIAASSSYTSSGGASVT